MHIFEIKTEIISRLKSIYINNEENVNWISSFYVDWRNNFLSTERFAVYLSANPVFLGISDEQWFLLHFEDTIKNLIACFNTLSYIHPTETFEQIGLRIIGEDKNNA